MMRRLQLAMLAVGLFCACTPRYTTFVADDPAYLDTAAKKSVLPFSGEPWQLRAGEFDDVSPYSPSEGEPYTAYHSRLINSLLVQEFQSEQFSKDILEKRTSIARLEALNSELLAQNVDMRLTAGHAVAAAQEFSATSDVLFKKYLVRPGDSLQSISFRAYGTYTGWLMLYRFNRSRLPDGPNKIKADQILFLPEAKKAMAVQIHRRSRS